METDNNFSFALKSSSGVRPGPQEQLPLAPDWRLEFKVRADG